MHHFVIIPVLLNYAADLNTIKNYSIILGAFFTSLTGMLGTILGAFYYFHKLDADKKINLEEAKERQVTFLLGELNSYDDKVDALLNKEFANEDELSLLRNKIQRGFESIVPLLEENTLDLGDDHIDLILEVNSFVENSEVITESAYQDVFANDISLTRDNYIEKIKMAKHACVSFKAKLQ